MLGNYPVGPAQAAAAPPPASIFLRVSTPKPAPVHHSVFSRYRPALSPPSQCTNDYTPLDWETGYRLRDLSTIYGRPISPFKITAELPKKTRIYDSYFLDHDVVAAMPIGDYDTGETEYEEPVSVRDFLTILKWIVVVYLVACEIG